MVFDPQSRMVLMESRPIRIILGVIKFCLAIFLCFLSLFAFVTAYLAYNLSLFGFIISIMAGLYAFPLTYFLFNPKSKTATGCLHIILSFMFVFTGMLVTAVSIVGSETKAYVRSKNAVECTEPDEKSVCKSIPQNSLISVDTTLIKNDFAKTKNDTWIKMDAIALEHSYNYLKIKYSIDKANKASDKADKGVSKNVTQKNGQNNLQKALPKGQTSSEKPAKKRASLLKKILMYPIKVE